MAALLFFLRNYNGLHPRIQVSTARLSVTTIRKGPPFIKYEVPKPPTKPGGITTQALGEEGGGGTKPSVTTKALGEEGGTKPGPITTMAVGEEGGTKPGPVTTMAVGEEGGTK
jgi:hypothetical protein